MSNIPQKRPHPSGSGSRAAKMTSTSPAIRLAETDKTETAAHLSNPFIPAFEFFRAELDEHHDRRERVAKASRDVTAASKKMIFALQRAPPTTLGQPLPAELHKQLTPQTSSIHAALSLITNDLEQSLNAHRYARSVSPGLQEWAEAVVFERYLESGKLLTFVEARSGLARMIRDAKMEGDTNLEQSFGLELGYEDYILGLFDATGEIMRFAVTAMATTGSLPSVTSLSLDSSADSELVADGAANTATDADAAPSAFTPKRTILTDLQGLLQGLVRVDVAANFPYTWRGKMEVAKQSTEKVERALYGLVVRGAERPKGWMPDFQGSARAREGEDD